MKSKTGLVLLLVILSSICILPITAYADTGPKPQITVIVKNPPEEQYYLDLLVYGDMAFNNLEDKSKLDQEKLSLLEGYQTDGWYPALTHGTNAPLFGTLTGTRYGNDMKHTFSYFGVPDEFKIIIITPDNRVLVTDVISRKAFDFTVTYDYETGNVILQKPALLHTFQFFKAFLPSLIIEGLLLIAFGFSMKRNWKPFLLANLLTQVFLNLILTLVSGKIGVFWTLALVFLPLEIIVFIAETAAYRKFFKEYDWKRRMQYAVTANAASLFISLFLWIAIF